MNDQYSVSAKLKYVSLGLMAIGLAALIMGMFNSPARAWANILLGNYYFLSIALGATFFLAIQHITQSGWSAMFLRIPESIGSFIPVAGVIMLALLFGSHYLYEWTGADNVAQDALIQHKSPYLNIPFFTVRIVVFFAIWTIMSRLLRRESLSEDLEGGMAHFDKSEVYSKVFIFIMAITFSLGTFDWIMSIDVHWFSTIFAVKNLISAFYHASAVILFIVLLLNRKGHFKLLNKYHLHDFSRYMFMLCIMWGYFWFCQYLLMWFANIPEETVYYVTRFEDEWKPVFFLNITLNFIIPFVTLLFNQIDRSKNALLVVVVVLMIGQWVDLYLQITPGAVGEFHFGFSEIGIFLGFIGLFAFIITKALSKVPLIPKKHPYLEESMYHRF